MFIYGMCVVTEGFRTRGYAEFCSSYLVRSFARWACLRLHMGYRGPIFRCQCWTNVQTEFFLPLRGPSCSGSSPPVFGLACLGPPLFILDFVCLEPSMLVSSFMQADRTPFASDYASMQSSLSLRGFGRLGSSMLAYGMT